MISLSKNVHMDKLADTVTKYNNTIIAQSMKFVNVESSSYIYFGVENNDKNSKFKVDYVPNWSDKFFMIKNVKDTVS